MKSDRAWLLGLMLPCAAVFLVFFEIPLTRLLLIGGSGELGWAAYSAAFTEPRYLRSMLSTVVLSALVTLTTLVISSIAGVFLARHEFAGRQVLTAMLTLPLAFPGVVIPLATELLVGERMVFAYSMAGLFVGYIYFSIPRTILTVMAAAEKLDPQLVEAARSLGASHWHILRDVLIPGLQPALLAAGAICFATSMGAFGTAFTLATRIDVLPMIIYTEFTLQANIAMAAALSFVLGLLTWAALAFARTLTGNSVAAAA